MTKRRPALSRGALGFETLDAYLDARPGVPYPALADELGPDVFGVQLAEMQFSAAKDAGSVAIKSAAADSLSRCIRQVLTSGRGQTAGDGVSADFVNITAWSTWTGLVGKHLPNEEAGDSAR